jgi:hypothetical protein
MRLATDLWKSTRVTRTTRKVRASVVHVRASRSSQKVEAQAPSTTWRLSFATSDFLQAATASSHFICGVVHILGLGDGQLSY